MTGQGETTNSGPLRNPRPLGLPDEAFEQRRPLRGQITKREVRALSLYSLGLRSNGVVWDIGAGSGSVAIEAALIAHDGAVYAVERDEESVALLRINVERWGSGNVHVVSGEAPEALTDLPDPDSVFIGGSGGKLVDIIEQAAKRLKPGGRIAANFAALERAQQALDTLKGLGFQVDLVLTGASRGKELPSGGTRFEALNPVFVVSASREAPTGVKGQSAQGQSDG